MKTLICIEHMSYSSFNCDIITNANEYIEKSTNEISFFSLDQTVPFLDINTAIFHPSEMDSFSDGLIISGTIDTANMIIGGSNNSKKLLYLYDLDWMFKHYNYDYLYSVLSNKNLMLIARHESHVCPIKNLCNREPDGIINSFDLEKIWNLL